MTVTVDVPKSAEKLVLEEAARAGMSVSEFLAQLVSERFHDVEVDDSLSRLVAKIGGTAPSGVDISREGIYADL